MAKINTHLPKDDTGSKVVPTVLRPAPMLLREADTADNAVTASRPVLIMISVSSSALSMKNENNPQMASTIVLGRIMPPILMRNTQLAWERRERYLMPCKYSSITT